MEKCLDPLTIDPNVCPPMKAPAGFIPMDPNAPTYVSYVIATNLIGLLLVVSAVAIRMYTRLFILTGMLAEDCKLTTCKIHL
jgi:hypothetical protein